MTYLEEETSKKYAILGFHRLLKSRGREAPRLEPRKPVRSLRFGSALALSARARGTELPTRAPAPSTSADPGAGLGCVSVFTLTLLYCGSDALKVEGTPWF